MPPKLILFIPQLIQPLKVWRRDFDFSPSTPVFSKLLQSYKAHKTSSDGFERSLYSALGLSTEKELPIAQDRYSNKKNYNENKKQNKKQWPTLICADPVHCEIGMKDITLTQAINDLTRSESEELLGQLNDHFSVDGLKFLLDENNHWYLALQQEETIASSVLSDVIGKNIFSYLPKSETRNWQKIQNEIQMLLHLSSLNQSREIAGLPTINSLWFWGGGHTFKPTNHFNLVYGGESNESLIGKSIANVSNCEWRYLPDTGQDILDHVSNNSNENNDTVVILDHLQKPSIEDDFSTWQKQITRIEEQYITPFMSSWSKGEIILEINDCSGKRIIPLKTSAFSILFKKLLKGKPKSLLELGK